MMCGEHKDVVNPQDSRCQAVYGTCCSYFYLDCLTSRCLQYSILLLITLIIPAQLHVLARDTRFSFYLFNPPLFEHRTDRAPSTFPVHYFLITTLISPSNTKVSPHHPTPVKMAQNKSCKCRDDALLSRQDDSAEPLLITTRSSSGEIQVSRSAGGIVCPSKRPSFPCSVSPLRLSSSEL